MDNHNIPNGRQVSNLEFALKNLHAANIFAALWCKNDRRYSTLTLQRPFMEKLLSAQNIEQQIVDFLSWFQREYLRRRKKNESYSVRAFAMYLDLSSATVSQLLAGKRRPSAKFAIKLLSQLDANPKEREAVLSSLIKKKKTTEAQEMSSEHKYQMIAIDSFKLLSDWFHYAILELTSVNDFKFDYAWIAGQLNISTTEARQAVERLLRLDLIEEKNGTIVRTKGFVTNYEEGLTTSALKLLQRHVLQKALDAIELVPAHKKDITSMTMAIDEKKIPEAKKLIKKFRRELCEFLETGNQTRVFNLGIQLYPVSKGPKK